MGEVVLFGGGSVCVTAHVWMSGLSGCQAPLPQVCRSLSRLVPSHCLQSRHDTYYALPRDLGQGLRLAPVFK